MLELCNSKVFCILEAPPILRIGLLRNEKSNSPFHRVGHLVDETLSSPKRTIHTVALAQICNMDSEPLFFELSDSGNFLKISALNLCQPNSEDKWELNWLNCKIEVRSGAFSGSFEGTFMTTDFESFKQQLKRLYHELKGNARFDCLDEFVGILMTGDGIGHLNSECSVRQSNMPLNELSFELNFDQTYLPQIINQLNNITKEFPIIGEFNIRNEY